MKSVRVEEAVGKKLAHDYTCIEPGFKGAVKKRGETVNPGDIELLKKCGHFYVYVVENTSGEGDYLHEVEAVLALGKAISGSNVQVKTVSEGKAYLYASANGLLLVNSRKLREINSTGVFVVVTKRTGSYVKVGDVVGVVDLVPLTVERSVVKELAESATREGPVIHVVETKRPRVGLLVTGTEIVEKLREDLATPIVKAKLERYDCSLGSVHYARDDLSEIVSKLVALLESHDAVVVTGGMSVDPTDYTPRAISSVADEVVAYGIPIKPTTMSMVAYRGNKAIVGVSAGLVHFPEENVLDVVLPWVSAGVKIPRDYIVSLGEGGLMQSFLKKQGLC